MKLLGLLLAATLSAQTIVVSPDGPIRTLAALPPGRLQQVSRGHLGRVCVRSGRYSESSWLLAKVGSSLTRGAKFPNPRDSNSAAKLQRFERCKPTATQSPAP